MMKFIRKFNKGLGKYRYTKIAPGFGSDFVVLIEHNRRRSQGYVEDFAIEARRKMARRRDAIWDIGIFWVPNINSGRSAD